ncbi:MAG: ABC transporter permease [Planctomycetes bacterium]|nr:ABC transporter permease [Planctomycetota bacterium]
MKAPWLLVGRHLRAHWLRTGLTFGSLFFALFLFCLLVSLVTTLDDAIRQSADDRVIVQSAVSLFVDLPLDYQPKIEAVPGIERVSKFQWFGGFYQSREDFFAQFGVDHDRLLEMYGAEMGLLDPEGTVSEAGRELAQAGLDADRRACIIGEGLARQYGWKVGSTVPLQSGIFPMRDGSAWEFNVVGVYRPLKRNFDDRTIFFRYDFLDETREAGLCDGGPGVGVYSVNLAEGADAGQVIAGIDRIFENGPQKTFTVTEAAFQQTFISMMGNVPFFVGTIGGAVVFAVVFSVVNTMLMSSRQRAHELGILKALGFSDGAVGTLLMVESLLLSLLGGGLGVGFAWVSQEGIRVASGAYLPTYAVNPSTAGWGLLIALGIGLVAGLGPSVAAARLRPVQALRSEG